MSGSFKDVHGNPVVYVAASLGEIYDLLGSMILWAPTFRKPHEYRDYRGPDFDFHALTEGFKVVRKKVGEENYFKLVDLAARAKWLFAEDLEDNNGKASQGRDLLYEIEDIIKAARSGRRKAKLKDDNGEITGD